MGKSLSLFFHSGGNDEKGLCFAVIFLGFMVTFGLITFFCENYDYGAERASIWPIFLGLAVMVLGVVSLASDR